MWAASTAALATRAAQIAPPGSTAAASLSARRDGPTVIRLMAPWYKLRELLSLTLAPFPPLAMMITFFTHVQP